MATRRPRRLDQDAERDRYKPSAIRSYDSALRLRILPELGHVRLGDITRRDVQAIADKMLASGCDASTIRNALMPLRVIYRRALEDGDVAISPCSNLRLPAVRGKRDRIASPAEAAEILAALPEQDRPLWATAFYAGLRRGELMALRWEDFDLVANVLRVERSWDERDGLIEPKSSTGRRTVPIPAVLREYLLAQKMRAGRPDTGLVFGATPERPFTPSAVWRRARDARKAANAKKELGEQKLDPIGLHDARHTYASLMIAAVVNAKALSTYMGHASVMITLDRYGHLMPGNEEEAASLLDAYLERRVTGGIS